MCWHTDVCGTPGRGLEMAEICLQPGKVRGNTHWAIPCNLGFALGLCQGAGLWLWGHYVSMSHMSKRPMERTMFPCIPLVHRWSSVWVYTTPGTKENGNRADIPILQKSTCGCLRNMMTWRLFSPRNPAAWKPFKALHANSITVQMA